MIDKNKEVLDFIKQYPPLKKAIQFNALSIKSENYSIHTIDSDEIIKQYTTGLKRKVYSFAITGIKKHDNQGISEINVNQLYLVNEFVSWLKTKAKEGIYPNIGEVTKMEVIPARYDGADGTLAKYTFNIRIEYLEKEE